MALLSWVCFALGCDEGRARVRRLKSAKALSITAGVSPDLVAETAIGPPSYFLRVCVSLCQGYRIFWSMENGVLKLRSNEWPRGVKDRSMGVYSLRGPLCAGEAWSLQSFL